MSEDSRKQEYTPLNLHPFVGLDLGERWGREVGELSQRLTHVEQAVGRLETKTDTLSGKVEEIVHILARHDERFNSLDERFNSLEKRIDDRFISSEKRTDERFISFDEKIISLEKRIDERFISLEKRIDERFISSEKRTDERFRSFDERLISLEKRMDDKFAQMDDKFTNLFAGLEKRLDHNNKMLWGMFTAMLAAIIIQKFI